MKKKLHSLTGCEVQFDDIKLPEKGTSPVFDPRLLETAIEKYVGNSKKIKKFREALETISNVEVIQSEQVIERLRDAFFSEYPRSSEIAASYKALDLHKTTQTVLARRFVENETKTALLHHDLSAKFEVVRELQKDTAEQLQDALEQKKTLTVQLEAVRGQLGNTEEQLQDALEQKKTLTVQLEAVRGQLGNTEEQLQDVLVQNNELSTQLKTIETSRSWRITQPLRNLVQYFRRICEPRTSCGLGAKCIMGLCLLPVLSVYYRRSNSRRSAIRTRKKIFSQILDNKEQFTAQCALLPKLFRTPLFTLYATALAIRCNGGVFPLIRKCIQAIHQGNVRTITRRLQPDRLPETLQISRSSPEPHKILVVDTRIPRSNASAGELSTLGILSNLAQFGFSTDFATPHLDWDKNIGKTLSQEGVNVLTGDNRCRSLKEYIAQEGHLYATFYLIRTEVAEPLIELIRTVAPKAKVLFHAPDLAFLRAAREAQLFQDNTLRTKAETAKKQELALINRVDGVIAVSPDEGFYLEEHKVTSPIYVFPSLYVPMGKNPPPFTARRHIFFLGGFAHAPNIDAVLWFVKEIWPSVHAALPDAQFHIIGSEMPANILSLSSIAGVIIKGQVDNLPSLLQTLRLGVAPLRYGAGIKGKVAMTMGAGIPCICTSVAAEGMSMEHGKHTLIADTPADFTEAVIQLYSNAAQWHRFSEQGYELIDSSFSAEANKKTLRKLLQKAGLKPKAGESVQEKSLL